MLLSEKLAEFSAELQGELLARGLGANNVETYLIQHLEVTARRSFVLGASRMLECLLGSKNGDETEALFADLAKLQQDQSDIEYMRELYRKQQ